MTYQLPPDLDERVQSQIALGLFKSPAEVLTEALNALDQRLEDLASIERGIADEGAARFLPLAEFDVQIRTQLGLTSHE